MLPHVFQFYLIMQHIAYLQYCRGSSQGDSSGLFEIKSGMNRYLR